MNPTEFTDVNATLGDLLSEMQRVLAEKLVGLYLYGSLATGGFVPGRSDIDLLAAVSSDVDDPEFDELEHMHADLAGSRPEWDDRIEVQYVPLVALRTFKTQPRTVPVISPGEPFHWREVDRDWTMNWYDVQQNGVRLFGPDPRTLIAPISRAEFIQSIREHAEQWMEHIKLIPRKRGSQAYAVLTMCRALYTCNTGQQVSKQEAARWAQEALPEWAPLIERALEWRQDAQNYPLPEDEATFQTTSNFVHVVADRVLNN
jgi:hypothetical protein